jgi:chorismate lyase / 3-hydroxybenzoate synthase
MIRPEHSLEGSAVAPSVDYVMLAPGSTLPADVLAAIGYGGSAPVTSDPRCMRVSLRPLSGGNPAELWRAADRVQMGREGPVRFAADPHYLAGMIELDEHEYGGLAVAAEQAYAAIRRFHSSSSSSGSGHPHLLRAWNYFDAINRGAADAERYKQFCLGRARGLAPWSASRYPAATAVGRRDAEPKLQVFWLAGCAPGIPLENPRQVSAYRYPRRYGPAAPSFARAMYVAQRLLLVSGTASIVGHASRHAGCLTAQINESLANLHSILGHATAAQPTMDPGWSERTLFKVYLRDGAAAREAAAHLAERLPGGPRCLLLEADICRSELLVEIECVHGG